MNLRKHIIIVLFALVLYKSIEPLVFSLIYIHQASLLTDSSPNTYVDNSQSDSSDSNNIIETQSVETSKKGKIIKVTLTGNRIDHEKQKAFTESINKMLDHQQERPKPQFISFDFALKYLCPVLNSMNIGSIDSYRNQVWTFEDTLSDYYRLIITPPPQNSNSILFT